MPFCMYCGNQEPEGAVFCGSCGQPMMVPSRILVSNDPGQGKSGRGKELTATLTQQEAEPHEHSHHQHKHGRRGPQFRAIWQSKRIRTRVIKLILAVALVAAAIAGVSKGVVPYEFPFGNNSPHQILVNLFTPQVAYAAYVGAWGHHGESLTIKTNFTGVELWHVGPCTHSSSEQWCNGNAKVTFTVNPDGSIKGTVQSVWYIWYTSSGSKRVPAGYRPAPSDPEVGDTFQLQHNGTHLLYTTWLGKSSNLLNENPRYWCDVYAENAGWGQYCGA